MARSSLPLLLGIVVLGAAVGLGVRLETGGRAAAAEALATTARWPEARHEVGVCTRHDDRPMWLTRQAFGSAVERATALWSDVHDAIRLSYEGDCAPGTGLAPASGTVPVAWDKAAFESRSDADSLTFLITRPGASPEVAEIRAASVLIDPTALDPGGPLASMHASLGALIAHEFGHLLGLGHSPVETDLLFDGPVTARTISGDDRLALREIYCPAGAH